MALAAAFLSNWQGGPLLLYALFIGMGFHYLSTEARSRPGIEFCGRTVLRLGVGLLGARITAAQIVGLGWETALIVVLGVASTLATALALGRRLDLSRAQSVLCGGAVAICGASAALAISAVLPREKDGERFTLLVVVTVTVLSTVAMVAYPLVAHVLQLPPPLAGLFLGGSIHDVAQVVGAGYSMDAETGDVATVVKLFRVAMLAAVVVLVGLAFKGARAGEDGPAGAPARQPIAPWFLWLFLALVALNSLQWLTPAVRQGLNGVSQACLAVAIAALGMKTSFRELARAGWRPLCLLVAESVWLALFVLAGIWCRSQWG